jgi:hypothetical protein
LIGKAREVVGEQYGGEYAFYQRGEDASLEEVTLEWLTGLENKYTSVS